MSQEKSVKTILLTGATSGIGREVAKRLHKQGYKLVLVGRNLDKLAKVASDTGISKNNIFEFNNQNIEQGKALFSDVVKKVGKLNGMICCAGFHEVKPLRVSKPEDYEKSFKLNSESAFVFSKFFSSPLYSEGEDRSIVLISSIASIVGEAGLIAYSAAKAGLVAGARCMALELSSKNIRVNCISPGWVNTEHAESVAKKLGPERVAELEKKLPIGVR
jgi:NAD(P)-dependent dehydrogenase (short-subunit alcohol dehydrogenase family)